LALLTYFTSFYAKISENILTNDRNYIHTSTQYLFTTIHKEEKIYIAASNHYLIIIEEILRDVIKKNFALCYILL